MAGEPENEGAGNTPKGIHDMGDLLQIARAEGQRLLHARVRVYPLPKTYTAPIVVYARKS